MRTIALHKKDIVINKAKLRSIIESRGMGFLDFHEKVVDEYGLDLAYKSFMTLLDNRSTWKLLYAVAITDTLNIDIFDVFELRDVDVDKKLQERKSWQDKYQKQKK